MTLCHIWMMRILNVLRIRYLVKSDFRHSSFCLQVEKKRRMMVLCFIWNLRQHRKSCYVFLSLTHQVYALICPTVFLWWVKHPYWMCWETRFLEITKPDSRLHALTPLNLSVVSKLKVQISCHVQRLVSTSILSPSISHNLPLAIWKPAPISVMSGELGFPWLWKSGIGKPISLTWNNPLVSAQEFMTDHVWERLHARFRDLCLQNYMVSPPSDVNRNG